MAVLTPAYEHLQNGQVTDFETTKEYRAYFEDQDIASAQALVTSDNNYLVMDADKLNDLCDTINYMQQIWADDKEEFFRKYRGMIPEVCITLLPEGEDCRIQIPDYSEQISHNTGSIVRYINQYYFCIADNVQGNWDDSKWIKIGSDDVGLEFNGLYGEESGLYVTLGVIPPDPTFTQLIWHAKQAGSTQEIVGYTYPNIRYRTDETGLYDNEIYMCAYEGGE